MTSIQELTHMEAQVASIIYLDAPAGVGLSYSTSADDYQTNDTQTAIDSHNFLLAFFAQFPDFATNPFYIAGAVLSCLYCCICFVHRVLPRLAAKSQMVAASSIRLI